MVNADMDHDAVSSDVKVDKLAVIDVGVSGQEPEATPVVESTTNDQPVEPTENHVDLAEPVVQVEPVKIIASVEPVEPDEQVKPVEPEPAEFKASVVPDEPVADAVDGLNEPAILLGGEKDIPRRCLSRFSQLPRTISRWLLR